MAPVLDGSTPTAVYNDTGGSTSLVTASFTPPYGSILVAKVAVGDSTTSTIAGVTGFTSRVNIAPANSTPIAIFTSVGAGVAMTVTATFGGSTSDARGLVVEVWTGAQLAATPATHSLAGAGTAPSDAITTVGVNSVVSWVVGDWSAINGTSTRVYRSSAVDTGFHWLSTIYTMYSAYQAAAAAGSQTYGLTAPTGQSPNAASIEIQASIPPSLVMPSRRAT